MPEKLSSFNVSNINMAGRGCDPLAMRPEIALRAMKVVASWSLLEAKIGYLCVKMLGANPLPGIAIYQAIVSTNGQREALAAVAKHALPAEQLEIFEAVLSFFGSAAKGRNKIAHGVWGYSDELPDAVLIGYAEPFVEYFAARVNAELEGKPLMRDFPRDDVYVWRAHDFDALVSDIADLTEWIETMEQLVTKHRDPYRNASALQRLKSAPRIRERLLRQRQKNSP